MYMFHLEKLHITFSETVLLFQLSYKSYYNFFNQIGEVSLIVITIYNRKTIAYRIMTNIKMF